MDINAKEKETAKIEQIESNLKTFSFSAKIGSGTVLFSVLKLKDSVLVWIGSSTEPRLVEMCVAIKSPYGSLPITSRILGSQADDFSTGLASNLTKRLGKPVFVSFNVELDRFLFPEVTKCLNEEIKNNPEYF